MPVEKPYRRTCRQFVDGKYAAGGRGQYVTHPKFAESPEHYVRAFLLLQKDLHELFDFVEPSDTNLPCYSYRIHSLLLRACVEVEANWKAILRENGYQRAGRWDQSDYRKIEKTHLLSGYRIMVPNWTGTEGMRVPFVAWSSDCSLPWYQAYNAAKHDRHSEFDRATFAHLLDACCGLLVLLSAQFRTEDFSPGAGFVALEGQSDGMESGIGGYFRVEFPTNWPPELRYDFDWGQLQSNADPFETIDYSTIP